MKADLIIAVGLSSIVLLSMMLIGLAIFMRRQWDGMRGSVSRSDRHTTPRQPHGHPADRSRG
jgi:predicted transporter